MIVPRSSSLEFGRIARSFAGTRLSKHTFLAWPRMSWQRRQDGYPERLRPTRVDFQNIPFWPKNVLAEETRRLSREIEAHQGRAGQLGRQSSGARSQPESEALQAELMAVVEHATGQLTIEQKQAVQLYYTEGMCLADGARQAECSIRAFESRLCRARDKLKRLLEKAEAVMGWNSTTSD